MEGEPILMREEPMTTLDTDDHVMRRSQVVRMEKSGKTEYNKVFNMI